MCGWIYKVKFDCDCSINNKGRVLFPKTCHEARKNFRGEDFKPGTKQALFCPLPPGGASGARKWHIHYRCSYHFGDSISAHEAEKRAARKPKVYTSVTAIFNSGYFKGILEENPNKILIRGLGWERKDLVVRPQEKVKMSGGLGRVKEDEKEADVVEKSEWHKAPRPRNERDKRAAAAEKRLQTVAGPSSSTKGHKAANDIQPAAVSDKKRPNTLKVKTGIFGGLFGTGKKHPKPGPSKKKQDAADPAYERVYPPRPMTEYDRRIEEHYRGRMQAAAGPGNSTKGKGRAPPEDEDEADPLVFVPGDQVGARSWDEEDNRSLQSNGSAAASDASSSRTYVSHGSPVSSEPPAAPWIFHS